MNWQSGFVSATPTIRVREAQPGDRTWIADLLERRWGSTTIVSRGRIHRSDLLPALVAEAVEGGRGLATYRIEDGEMEVVTLDAEPAGRGIGTALLTALAEVARGEGCRRLWLITTNDNLDAVRFYQHRGLRLLAVHRGAVDQARQVKPTIPPVGADGIRIRDELELSLVIDDDSADDRLSEST